MSIKLLNKEHGEKLLVLATLWTTFASAFLIVAVSNI